MDHTEATDSGAAERYVLGEMDEQERDRYEEHFFGCPECAHEVKATALFLDDAESVLGKDSQASVPDEEEGRKKANGHSRLRWTEWRALFFPLPLGAAAVMLLALGFSGYQGMVVLPHLRQELREAAGLQAAPGYFLSVSRSQPPVITVSGRQRMIVLTLSKSLDGPFPFYRCAVQDAQGRTVLSNVVAAPPEGDELQIALPTNVLRPGDYVVAVAGLKSTAGSAAPESAHYYFKVQG